LRSLVVAADYPWPEIGGSRIRVANTLSGLASAGTVDLLSAIPSTRDPDDFSPPPDTIPVANIVRRSVEIRPREPRELLGALVRGDPLVFPSGPGPAVRDALGEMLTVRYDLLWFFTVRAWVWAGMPHDRATVVDIDDLDDQKILARIGLPSEAPHLRRIAASAFWRQEVRRWQRLHDRIGRVTVPVLCSGIDVRRSGLRNGRVVPNGYTKPTEPLGRVQVDPDPKILFQGSLRNPPNADAARFLAREIAPLIVAGFPRARVRLVGSGPESLASEVDPSLVTIVGQVEDMRQELSVADLVVVPLRFASGTRIKILEAFAHRIPVVSTTIGAEGLDALDGVHLLLADSSQDISKACIRLLSDLDLRRTLVDNAEALFLKRYESSVVRDRVREVAEESLHRGS
jgi:glycosyltransferase involved in cell wall biosynthesis